MSSITTAARTVKPRPFGLGLVVTESEVRNLVMSGKGREGAIVRAAFHRDYKNYQITCRSTVDAEQMAIRGAIVALETFRAEKAAIVDRFARFEPTPEDRQWATDAFAASETNWDEYHDWADSVEPSLEGCDHWGGVGHSDGE